jgi:hypothetical protein
MRSKSAGTPFDRLDICCNIVTEPNQPGAAN